MIITRGAETFAHHCTYRRYDANIQTCVTDYKLYKMNTYVFIFQSFIQSRTQTLLTVSINKQPPVLDRATWGLFTFRLFKAVCYIFVSISSR